jgi:hypothetical protein
VGNKDLGLRSMPAYESSGTATRSDAWLWFAGTDGGSLAQLVAGRARYGRVVGQVAVPARFHFHPQCGSNALQVPDITVTGIALNARRVPCMAERNKNPVDHGTELAVRRGLLRAALRGGGSRNDRPPSPGGSPCTSRLLESRRAPPWSWPHGSIRTRPSTRHGTSAALVHFANTSYRVGWKITWDEAKKSFVNDSEAHKLLTRDYRKLYVV